MGSGDRRGLFVQDPMHARPNESAAIVDRMVRRTVRWWTEA